MSLHSLQTLHGLTQLTLHYPPPTGLILLSCLILFPLSNLSPLLGKFFLPHSSLNLGPDTYFSSLSPPQESQETDGMQAGLTLTYISVRELRGWRRGCCHEEPSLVMPGSRGSLRQELGTLKRGGDWREGVSENSLP